MKLKFLLLLKLVLLVSLTSNISFASSKEKSALIIIDMQNCFIEGNDPLIHGLPVKGGASIIKGINQIQKKFDLVVATKDWHPKNHISFASNHEKKQPYDNILLDGNITQTLWPDHCITGTKGADYAKGLDTSKVQDIIYKGTNPMIDSYSGFFDNAKLSKTILDKYLKRRGIKNIYIVGLAADFCVKFTALDGIELNYNTYIIKDLTKAVFPDEIDSVYKSMIKKGINIIKSSEL